MSESQERMMAVVEPDQLDEFLAITAKWDVEATVIGEVTDGGRLVVNWHGEIIVDVPPRSVAHEGPVYDRPLRAPGLAGRAAGRRADAGAAAAGDRRRAARDAAARWSARPTSATSPGSPTSTTATSWATPRSRMPDDAGVVRVDEETGRGVALATDCNGRFAKLDPYAGAQLALAEAYRNVATAGAAPLAVTDCLNFGSPEDPGVMWQFAEAVRGLADGLPGARHPGHRRQRLLLQPDRRRRDPPDAGRRRARRHGRRAPAHAVGLAHAAGRRSTCSARPRDELGGSEWAHVVHGHLGGLPPAVDLAAERRSARSSSTARATGSSTPRTTCPRAGSPMALAEALPAPRRRRPRLARRAVRARRHRRVHRAVQRVDRPGARRGAPLGGGAVHRHVRRPRLPHPASASSTTARRARPGARRPGAVHLPLAELRAAHEATLPAAFITDAPPGGPGTRRAARRVASGSVQPSEGRRSAGGQVRGSRTAASWCPVATSWPRESQTSQVSSTSAASTSRAC